MAETDLILSGQTKTATPTRVDSEVGPLVLDTEGNLLTKIKTVDGTPFNVTSTASTNLSTRKASPGNLYELTVSNPTATAASVKFYNKASNPTLASDIPLLTVTLAAGATQALNFGTIGKRFSAGIAMAITALPAATDTGNAVAGVQVSGTYL
jgi:hypothetical protein